MIYFDLLCALVERNYSETKLMEHMARAVPVVLPPRPEGSVYENAGGAQEVWEHFRLPETVIALEGEEECFVIADERSGQSGLGAKRVVVHASRMDDIQLPDVDDDTILPNQTAMVSVSRLWANSVEGGVPQFEGAFGFGFIASKKHGVIVNPPTVRRMTMIRALTETEDPNEREQIERFGHEAVLRASVGALERVIACSRTEFHRREPGLRAQRRRKRLFRARERAWLVT